MVETANIYLLWLWKSDNSRYWHTSYLIEPLGLTSPCYNFTLPCLPEGLWLMPDIIYIWLESLKVSPPQSFPLSVVWCWVLNPGHCNVPRQVLYHWDTSLAQLTVSYHTSGVKVDRDKHGLCACVRTCVPMGRHVVMWMRSPWLSPSLLMLCVLDDCS